MCGDYVCINFYIAGYYHLFEHSADRVKANATGDEQNALYSNYMDIASIRKGY